MILGFIAQQDSFADHLRLVVAEIGTSEKLFSDLQSPLSHRKTLPRTDRMNWCTFVGDGLLY